MTEDTIRSLREGPQERVSFRIKGVKEYEHSTYKGNPMTSQFISVEYEDCDGFVIVGNQPEITADQVGMTFLFISTKKTYEGNTKLDGVKLMNDKNGNPYFRIGKNAQRYVGSEVADAPEGNPEASQSVPATTGPQRTQKPTQSTQRACEPFEEQLVYCAQAIEMMKVLIKDCPPEVMAAVFNSSCYAYKDGIPLRKPLEKKAEEVFEAKDEDSDIPF